MKDPAVLFYTADFIAGTLTMTDEQRGRYILLLCLQHQQGGLSEEDMLNICKTYDVKVFSKFHKAEDGFYYNERMRTEADKRKKYSESRRNNRVTKEKDKKDIDNICKSYDKHMGNENICIDKSIVYSDFYDSEILKSESDENYLRIIKIIFGENEIGHKLSGVLRMKDQLSYDQAKKILSYKSKHGIVISEVLEEMENWKGLSKRTSVYKTFLTFMKNKYPETKDK